ncbi:glycosyltransferase [Falsiroseomonas sp. HC035]|uniref:glycosyltransferase n=1 Tax=Falsiroseomonas sp. HC035 TaxID=3390999 RepID=UPI003D31F0D6
MRALLLTAQMRRDRDRLAAAQAEIALLQARLARLELLAPTRAYRGAVRLYRQLPFGLRQAVHRLRGNQAAALAQPPGAAPQASPASRGRAIVIDDNWPRPDRDSGSLDIVNLVQSLDRLGFEVILAAAREHKAEAPARDALVAAGLRCLRPEEAPSVETFLEAQGPTLDLCVLCRVYCGGRFLEPALAQARKARIVFNSVDLHFLRLERQAHIENDAKGLAIAQQVRAREEAIIRASDATIVVSATELEFLAREVPQALAVELPLARRLVRPATGFSERRGIGFIGGFQHTPNIDAIRHFLAEIWPLVLRDLPEMELSIVGPDFPAELLRGVPGRVRALGHLPDVGPWFEELRLTIAPLRFGAGAKGKVASSLSAGVPCIATPVAAEGMSLTEASGVLVAEDAAAFAARLREAYSDAALWNRLSADGLAYAARTLSIEAWQARLDRMLRRIGL